MSSGPIPFEKIPKYNFNTGAVRIYVPINSKINFDIDKNNIFADMEASNTPIGKSVMLFDYSFFLNKEDFLKLFTKYIEKLTTRFGEFDIFYHSDNIITGMGIRKKYNGDPFLCSFIDSLYYYKTYNTNPFKVDILNYSTMQNSLDVILYTCDPKINNITYYNNNFINTCIYGYINPEYNNINIHELISNKCDIWFLKYLKENQFTTYNKELTYIVNKCSSYIDFKCQKWMEVFVKSGNPFLNSVNDKILRNQNDLYKLKYLKCAFPSLIIKSKEKYIIEPRICWDPNCIYVNDWELLTEDRINKAKCKNTNCNITLDYIKENINGSIKISCNIENTSKENGILTYRNIFNNFYNNFYFINFSLYIIIIFIFLIIYSFTYRYKKENKFVNLKYA